MKRLDYLTSHGHRAFVGIKNTRVFRYYQRVIDDPDKAPAWVSGVFNITLTMNLAHLRDAGTAYRAFIIDHETAHMRGHHGFWLLVCLLLCPFIYIYIRRFQEEIADLYGAVSLTDQQVIEVCKRLHSENWRHRLYYGDAAERAARILSRRR